MRGLKSSFAGSALLAIDEGISVEELSLTTDLTQRIRGRNTLMNIINCLPWAEFSSLGQKSLLVKTVSERILC